MALPDQISSIKNLFVDIKIDNRYILDIWTSWNITEEIKEKVKGYGEVSIESGDTWHNIAELVYGSRDLWWVLILFNEIEDPFSLFFDATVNGSVKKIKIVKPEYIGIILNDIRQKRKEKEEKRFDA